MILKRDGTNVVTNIRHLRNLGMMVPFGLLFQTSSIWFR